MAKTVVNTSTPIKPNFDPVSKNVHRTPNCTMDYQKIYPGIYLTSVKDLCSAETLKIYGFTHIIYIDKHIIENGVGSEKASTVNEVNSNNRSCHCSNPSDVIVQSNENVIKQQHPQTSITASIVIRPSPVAATSSNRSSAITVLASTSASTSSSTSQRSSTSAATTISHSAMDTERPPKRLSIATTSDCSISMSSMSLHQDMPIDDEPSITKSIQFASNENFIGHSDFETIDLNFGESSYLTTVLPNCYKAVKFIESALKNNGAVLVIDCTGENQKCITIVVGFLMYKYNKNFLNAYQLIKRLHPNIELDKFFTTQLYEYEPILQVQRSQSAGNSCSRELRSALLKRKKSYDDCYYYQSDAMMPTLLPHNAPYICSGGDNFINNVEQTTDILMEQ